MKNIADQPSPATTSFEESLRDLEATVDRLEAGELPLEESLTLFEHGVSSLKRCHAILDVAEKRVRILVKNASGAPILEDAGTAPVPLAAPSGSTAPIPAPIRKKSVKQSVDLEPPIRQNSASSPDVKHEPGQDELGPGGSLFGGAK